MPPSPEMERDGGCTGEGWVSLSLKPLTTCEGDARVQLFSPREAVWPAASVHGCPWAEAAGALIFFPVDSSCCTREKHRVPFPVAVDPHREMKRPRTVVSECSTPS